MKKLKKKKVMSIFKKVFVPIICVMILQSCVFYVTAVYGGMSEILSQNAKDNFINCASDREREIEKLFSEHWTNMEIYADSFDQLYEKYQKESDTPVYDNDDSQKEYLADISGILVSMLRNNGINGAYLILNDSKEFVPLSKNPNQNKYGICIRDYDQNSGYTEIEDLRLVRCPASMANIMNCPLEINWEAVYTFNDDEPGDYFYEPLKTAYENSECTAKEMAYFSEVYKFNGSDVSVVSYSIPLVTSAGYPYGVLGIELTCDYLQSLLPYDELGNMDDSGYALVRYKEGDNIYDVIAYNGDYITENFDLHKGISSDLPVIDNFFVTKGTKACVTISELAGYNDETMSDNKVALMGIISQENLYHFKNIIYRNMLIVTFVVLIIGMVAIYFVSRYFSKPITDLAEKVRTMEPEPNFELDRLGITEIDQLITSIEDMSRNISESEARTAFFSRMSHDMRTPMNAIIGFSSPELLEDADESAKDEYLEKIHVSGGYLLGLINEVLDMTKIDSGKMEIHEENMSLNEFWDANKIIIEKLAEDKQIEFKVNFSQSGVEYIIADYQRLSQIVINLLSNAIKFTDSGGHVSFSFNVLNVTSTEIEYCISVKDDGRGMSEEFLNRLYQPFVRGDNKTEGTGLGLVITKQLIELMGGHIECISKLGEGTEFLVYLSSRIGSKKLEDKDSDVEEKTDENKVLSEDVILVGKNILMCEDHLVNCQIAERLLAKKHMKVSIAHDGLEGIQLFEQSEPGFYDAILMDIRMPNLDGLLTTAEIRKLDRSDAKTIPIIAMTADAFVDDVKEAKEAGMNAHLSKPIDPGKLYSTLAQLFMGDLKY